MKTKRYTIRAFVLITSVLTICFAGQEPNPEWLLKMSQDEKGLQILKEYFLPLTPEQASNMSQDELLEFTLMQSNPRNSLKGLRGVTVAVEFLKPEAEKYGLTRETLQTDSELRLRRHGIKVIPSNELSQLDATLYINVNTVISDEFPLAEGNPNFKVAAVSVQVEVKQSVMLFRHPKIWTNAVTWRDGLTVLCGVNKLRSSVRETVRDCVDEFINDYLAANPTKNPPVSLPPTKATQKGLITAIAYSVDNPSAVINDTTVHEGDTVDGVTVVKIYEDRVVFEKEGTEAIIRWTQKMVEAPEANWE